MSDIEHGLDEQGREHVWRRPGSEVCDFCLAPNPRWEFPVTGEMPVVGNALITHSDDEWAACDECRELVEAADIGGLVERGVRLQPVHVPEGTRIDGGIVHYGPAPLMRRRLRENITMFFGVRAGHARLWKGEA